ncbi:MAG: glycosyltransferase family 2 protein [Lachnospiraceae bacterium]|jgi:glycosyltransferase involved in cell wall biosynthesis|nr:glycosyltransferase family 2 protein [Lachnospiraceae bacterium]MCI9098889.1 glycosyltransferase family 2 protein [Lachnospiraceae bacterium]MCI9356685.1 glycosyltransferase family 2 protein [Lachnospiraceae bacterium]
MDKVCILLSTFNGESYINEQLDSILRQTDVELQIIIRDDGSNDRTVDIITHYIKAYQNIKLYAGENSGPARSFMELIRIAPYADYYAFCDQDDVWMEKKLRNAILAIKEKYSTDVPVLYHSNLMVVDAALNPIMKSNKKTSKNRYACLVDNNVTGCTAVFNRSLIQVIRKYDMDNITMHDAWINIIATFFGKVVFDRNAYIFYRQHEKNVIGIHERNDLKKNISSGISRIKRTELQPRLKNANALYEAYGDLLNQEDLKQVTMIVNYKRSLADRIKLLLNYKIRSFSIERDIRYRLLILAGEI